VDPVKAPANVRTSGSSALIVSKTAAAFSTPGDLGLILSAAASADPATIGLFSTVSGISSLVMGANLRRAASIPAVVESTTRLM
jgi:hypothetical protein